MEGKSLIRITKNKVFLTPEICLNLSQTSLVGSHLSFRTVQDIYFEVEVLDYDQNTKGVSFNIINYQPKNIGNFNRQSAKAQVSFIHFTPLKWQQIEQHLSSYTKAKLLKEKIVIDDDVSIADYENSKQREPVIEKMTEEAKIYFKDADFDLGFVAFPYNLKG